MIGFVQEGFLGKENYISEIWNLQNIRFNGEFVQIWFECMTQNEIASTQKNEGSFRMGSLVFSLNLMGQTGNVFCGSVRSRTFCDGK